MMIIILHWFNDIPTFKISKLKDIAIKHNPDLLIEIDGGVTPENISKLINHGANTLVCGNGTIFRPFEDSIFNKVKYLRTII